MTIVDGDDGDDDDGIVARVEPGLCHSLIRLILNLAVGIASSKIHSTQLREEFKDNQGFQN